MFTAFAQGQQLGQFSQYVQNPMILNPAATGIYDYTDINLSMRKQWSGLDGSPTTFYGSVNASLRKKVQAASFSPSLRTSATGGGTTVAVPDYGRKIKHGIGGYLLSDEYGAFQKMTGNVSYALHIPIGETYWISGGLGLAISNLAFDQDRVSLVEGNDNTYTQFIANGTSSTFFDLNAGIYLYSDNLFLGYATNQLLGDAVTFGDKLGDADLQIHHFATLGYRINVNDNFALTPSAMVKIMSPTPASFDITMKAEFQEKFWLGASYRHTDAVVGLVGFNLNNVFKLGYSYDFTLSNLNSYNSGSHEIVLGIMLGRNK